MAFAAKIVTQNGEHNLMGELPSGSQYPQTALFWDVVVRMPGGELEIVLDRVAQVDIGSSDYNDFENYLLGFLRGNQPAWNAPTTAYPGKSGLSMRYDGYAYMVFLLRRSNWRYSRGQAPFTVEKGREQYYTTARCAWINPINNNLEVDLQAPSRGSCDVAFFVANAAQDQNDNGNNGEFRSAFNIYVDLTFGGVASDRYLPIVIDPDVGFPEGTSPP